MERLLSLVRPLVAGEPELCHCSGKTPTTIQSQSAQTVKLILDDMPRGPTIAGSMLDSALDYGRIQAGLTPIKPKTPTPIIKLRPTYYLISYRQARDPTPTTYKPMVFSARVRRSVQTQFSELIEAILPHVYARPQQNVSIWPPNLGLGSFDEQKRTAELIYQAGRPNTAGARPRCGQGPRSKRTRRDRGDATEKMCSLPLPHQWPKP
jgi:hypothetical protein